MPLSIWRWWYAFCATLCLLGVGVLSLIRSLLKLATKGGVTCLVDP